MQMARKLYLHASLSPDLVVVRHKNQSQTFVTFSSQLYHNCSTDVSQVYQILSNESVLRLLASFLVQPCIQKNTRPTSAFHHKRVFTIGEHELFCIRRLV